MSKFWSENQGHVMEEFKSLLANAVTCDDKGEFSVFRGALVYVRDHVLFEASSRDAVERAIAELDAAWDARAK